MRFTFFKRLGNLATLTCKDGDHTRTHRVGMTKTKPQTFQTLKDQTSNWTTYYVKQKFDFVIQNQTSSSVVLMDYSANFGTKRFLEIRCDKIIAFHGFKNL